MLIIRWVVTALNTEREESRRVVRLRHLPVLPGESTPPRAVVRSLFLSTPTAGSCTPLLPLALFWPSSSLLTLVVQVTRRRVSFAVDAALDVWMLLRSFPLRVRWLGMDAPLSFLARVLVLLSMCCSTAACLRPTDLPLSPSALCFTDRRRWTVEASKGCLVILACSWFSENHSKINIR